MPKKTRKLDRQLNDIVSEHVKRLVEAIELAVRQSVVLDIRAYLGNGAARTTAGSTRSRRSIQPCIAPGCGNPSKGPRFHYLCEAHKSSPKKDYESWRKARQEKERRERASARAA